MEVLTKFNEAMWEGLQKGSVVVHCLAGVHRAACVVVSHFLWRYYKQGHTYLSPDIAAIYECLGKRRYGVAPLDYVSLVKQFEEHLKSQ